MERKALQVTLGIVAATAVTLVASACSSSSGTSSGDGTSAAATVSLRIGTGVDASYAPFFLADQEGLFKKAGLNVQLVKFSSGGDATTAVGAGSIQMTVSSDITTTSLMASNTKLVAFAAYETMGKVNKAVLRKGITSPSQIKTFGYVAGLSQYAAYKYLTANHINPSSVKMVSATPQTLPTLLQRGNIDGFVLWDPWPGQVVSQGTGYVAEEAEDFGVVMANWLITSKAYMASNSATLQKVADVLATAEAQVEKDPNLAAQATDKAIGLAPSAALAEFPDIDFDMQSLTSQTVTHDTDVAGYFKSIGSISALPDLKDQLVLNWYKG